MALICITFAVLYFFIAEGSSGFRNTFYGKEETQYKDAKKIIQDDDNFEAAPIGDVKV